MTRVSFLRQSSAPPPLREILDVDGDGSWRAWRSIATAVGRFASRDGGERVVAAARVAAGAAPPEARTASGVLDEATDEIDIDGTALEVGHGEAAPGPWGDALAACRDLIAAAPEHPLAAIGAEVPEPGVVRLVHRGTEPLAVELGSGRVEATAYDDAGIPTESTFGPVDLGQVDAGPGWSADVRVEPPALPPGGRLEVEVSFVAVDNGAFIPVSVVAAWEPAAGAEPDQVATRS